MTRFYSSLLAILFTAVLGCAKTPGAGSGEVSDKRVTGLSLVTPSFGGSRPRHLLVAGSEPGAFRFLGYKVEFRLGNPNTSCDALSAGAPAGEPRWRIPGTYEVAPVFPVSNTEISEALFGVGTSPEANLFKMVQFADGRYATLAYGNRGLFTGAVAGSALYNPPLCARDIKVDSFHESLWASVVTAKAIVSGPGTFKIGGYAQGKGFGTKAQSGGAYRPYPEDLLVIADANGGNPMLVREGRARDGFKAQEVYLSVVTEHDKVAGGVKILDENGNQITDTALLNGRKIRIFGATDIDNLRIYPTSIQIVPESYYGGCAYESAVAVTTPSGCAGKRFDGSTVITATFLYDRFDSRRIVPSLGPGFNALEGCFSGGFGGQGSDGNQRLPDPACVDRQLRALNLQQSAFFCAGLLAGYRVPTDAELGIVHFGYSFEKAPAAAHSREELLFSRNRNRQLVDLGKSTIYVRYGDTLVDGEPADDPLDPKTRGVGLSFKDGYPSASVLDELYSKEHALGGSFVCVREDELASPPAMPSLPAAAILTAPVTGTWITNGKFATVAGSGSTYTFTNENGDSATGVVTGPASLYIDKWDVDVGYIPLFTAEVLHFSNQSEWSRNKTGAVTIPAPPPPPPALTVDILGAWSYQGRATQVATEVGGYTLTNEDGKTTFATVSSTNTLRAVQWKLDITVSANSLNFSNGSTWTRSPAASAPAVPPPSGGSPSAALLSLNISGAWSYVGKTTQVSGSGSIYTLTNENGGITSAVATSATTLHAQQWNLDVTVSATALSFSNGTTWTRAASGGAPAAAAASPAADLIGNWSFKGNAALTCQVVANDSSIDLINEHGSRTLTSYVSASRLTATTWGNLGFTVSADRRTLTFDGNNGFWTKR